VTGASTPPEALIGQVLGGAYRILRRIDEGGMGTVFAAEHVRLKRPVAVKVMAAHLAEDESALLRFTREAEIISQLHHPHVVQVLDFDTTDDGKPYLVMELLQGRSLDQVLARHRKLAIGAALRVAIQAASALSAAHSVGIVHRDLKPGNIFLVDTGDQLFVKLLDFGISKRSHEEHNSGRKLTGEFDILGTPDYMAPEQALGRTAAVDHRGDQYALGVILYEMVTGQVPFAADDVMELLQRVIKDSPVAPSALREDLPRAVDGVILRALAKTPDERFSSIAEFAESLEVAAAEHMLSVAPALGRGTDPLRADSSGVDTNARTSHITPQLARDEPTTDTRRTSWHSKDPVRATQELIDRARQELGLDNLELAVSCAESAFEIAQLTNNPAVKELLSKNATLLARIFERRLGGLRSTILVLGGSAQGMPLTPEQAYLLSRLDGGLSIEEALDLSPMSRELTLGHLVSMMRTGHISLSA
jgi:serine/threonine protein kinase